LPSPPAAAAKDANAAVISITAASLVFMIPQMLAQQAGGGGMFPLPPGVTLTTLRLIYTGMAIAGLVPGVLHLVAGIRNLSYRGRGLGLTALFTGILAIGTCYCSVTSIGLLIYGAIVYFNEQTARAFELGEQGYSTAEIKEMLRGGGLGERPPERRPPLPPRPRDEDDDWLSRKPS